MTTTKPLEHFHAGHLNDALQAATDSVREDPMDLDKRLLMAQLLCFIGDLERADKQLEVITQQDAEAAVGTTVLRHLIRAETDRQAFFTEGRLPQFIEPPSETMKHRLEASVLLRDGDRSGAVERLAKANASINGNAEVDGASCDDFRDLDDLLAGVFEVLSANGRYYWFELHQLDSLTFEQPEQPCDLLWRPAEMKVRNGPDGRIFVPVCYPGSHEFVDDDEIRLGRATEWIGDDDLIQGRGHRMYHVNGESRGIIQLGSIRIMQSSATTQEEAAS